MHLSLYMISTIKHNLRQNYLSQANLAVIIHYLCCILKKKKKVIAVFKLKTEQKYITSIEMGHNRKSSVM